MRLEATVKMHVVRNVTACCLQTVTFLLSVPHTVRGKERERFVPEILKTKIQR